MRAFLLVDNDGNAYNLTSESSAFFYDVSGLGYEKEATFQRVQNRFTLLKKHYMQQKISGTVRFWQDDAEEKYFTFAQFCQNSPLRMVYNPDDSATVEYGSNHVDGTTLYLSSTYLTAAGTYFRDGYVTKIERSDGNDGRLVATIEFTALTPWYKKLAVYNYGSSDSGGKEYDYEYNYKYVETVNNVVSVTSDSRQSSPTKIYVIGPANNPAWNYYHDGVLTATGKVNVTIPTDYRLVIDSTTVPFTITEYDDDGAVVGDMYQLSDFSTDRFINFDYGKNTLSFSDDDGAVFGVGVEAQIQYATV